MASPKDLDLSAARLTLGGYNLNPGKTAEAADEITFRHWRVKLPTGDLFDFDYYRLTWRRWMRPSKETYRADHWRNASKRHAGQLTEWLHAHPDYVADTHDNRFIYGLARSAIVKD